MFLSLCLRVFFVPLEERTSEFICEESVSYLDGGRWRFPRLPHVCHLSLQSAVLQLNLDHLTSSVTSSCFTDTVIFQFLQNMFLFNPLSDPLRVICTVEFSGGLEPIHAIQSSI